MASPIDVGTVTVSTVPTPLTITRFPPIHVTRNTTTPITITPMSSGTSTPPPTTGRLWPRVS